MTEINAPSQRLIDLRQKLSEIELDGFIIPHADEHQSEYLPPSAERLAWLTGFDGSAGAAVVLSEKAAIFVDGRYTLQVRDQVDGSLFDYQDLIATPPSVWLADNIQPGDRIGYDPWLMTVAEVKRLTDACTKVNAELVAVDANPVDAIWAGQPVPRLGVVSLHPESLAGEPAADKIARLQESFGGAGADAAILGQTDSIAWLLNIRGTDILHNPVCLAWVILPKTGKLQLFVDGRKLSNTVRDALSDVADVEEPDRFTDALAALGQAEARIQIEPRTTAQAIANLVENAGGTIVDGADPVTLAKALKNDTEIAGAHRAQVRDGAAMVRFLIWLDANAGDGTVDELTAADRLEAFRAETAKADGSELRDLSFDTISGAGPNGAIVHYRVTPRTNRKLEPGSLYLVDSGGQYPDGTTDITRTVAIGDPTPLMRDRFTRVLKGHIALATARFPAGTTGVQLDTLARLPLWIAGLDFDHGTGHGVGSFLNVHEGPASISKRGTVALQPGMILSNEPGFYETGQFGIRIENLILVKSPSVAPGGDREMLSFETLTLCPIDRRLIDPALLSDQEIAWIDGYHAGLLPALGHLLDDAERTWLEAATQPLA